MWAYRLIGPLRLERISVPEPKKEDLRPGEVLLRLRLGGVCGSDVPKFLGTGPIGPTDRDDVGFPLHEMVSEVVASASDELPVGARVVGYAREARGLQEFFVSPDDMVRVVPEELADLDAIAVQPLATVLNSFARVPAYAGESAAVIGLGPLGLLFASVLRHGGAARIVGIDPVDRSELAARYGVDELVTTTGEQWAAALDEARKPFLCVEAVGHQVQTMVDAVRATAFGGHVISFGVVDVEDYPIPFRTLFRKNLSLSSGTTVAWREYLASALELVGSGALDLEGYVTHALPIDQAQQAFELAAVPSPERLKVVVQAD